jgi:hypothetical protein
MGMPPEDLFHRIGNSPIPTAPKDVAVGIPADLLRRRPDVRATERRLAAQCAAIGIAESEFYPHISIDGTLGWSAQNLGHLFEPAALNGNVGPAFTWNLLNYGRLLNNVKFQDARFQELIATYQNTVLSANQDVENGLITFLKAQERTGHQQISVDKAVHAVQLAIKQYQAGTADFTTVTQVEQIQVQQQDLLAQAEGEIDTGLIAVYRALGGGWQIRLQGCNEVLPPPGAADAKTVNPEPVAPPPSSPQELPMPSSQNTYPLPMPPSQIAASGTAEPIQLPIQAASFSPTVLNIPNASATSAPTTTPLAPVVTPAQPCQPR